MFAVDSARPGRLKALAVLAFCAEITRLPGHWSPRSSPVNATAHTTPSRLTTVAHICNPNPPFGCACAASRALRRAEWEGRPRQELRSSSPARARVLPSVRDPMRAVTAMSRLFVRIVRSIPLLGRPGGPHYKRAAAHDDMVESAPSQSKSVCTEAVVQGFSPACLQA